MNPTLVKPTDCRFLPNDTSPKEYGYICGKCNKRFGAPQPHGWVDVVRCEDCPKPKVVN